MLFDMRFLICLSLFSWCAHAANSSSLWSSQWTFSQCDSKQSEAIRSTLESGLTELKKLNSDLMLPLLMAAQDRDLEINCGPTPWYLKPMGWGKGASSDPMYVAPMHTVYLFWEVNKYWTSAALSGMIFKEFLRFVIPSSNYDPKKLGVQSKDGSYAVERNVLLACASTIYPEFYAAGPQFYILKLEDWPASRRRACEYCLRTRLEAPERPVISKDESAISAAREKCQVISDRFNVHPD